MNRKSNLKFHVTLILTACALCFLFVPLSKGQVVTINESHFRPRMIDEPNLYRLPHGDIIMLTQESASNVPNDEVEVVLILTRDLTMSKGISVPTSTRTVSAWARPDSRTSAFRMKRNDLERFGLIFEKQQKITRGLLLPPQEAYLFRPDHAGDMGGRKLIFTWQTDDWPQSEMGLDVSAFSGTSSSMRYGESDLIKLTQVSDTSPFGPGEIELVLASAPNVTWWKEIKLRMWTMGVDGRLVPPYTDVNFIHTEEADHGPKSFRVNKLDFIRRGELIFSKAKFLGARVEMYKIWGFRFANIDPRTRLTFTWQRD